ncbi:MAG: low molecular weight protein-tyrosine-phosphatase [Pseudomonadota bacterium]
MGRASACRCGLSRNGAVYLAMVNGKFRVLMVCSGNICRSPLAEAVLVDRKLEKVAGVSSAGIGALVGSAAHPEAIRVASEHGLDIGRHKARQFDQALAHDHDLVLVMENLHRQWIERAFPHLRGRVHLLGHWSKRQIEDPFRKGPRAFDRAMQEITQTVEEWCTRLS